MAVLLKTLFINRESTVFIERGGFLTFNSHLNPSKMENKQKLQEEIAVLEAQLTGDMFTDMDIKDKIHNLKMQVEGVRQMDSYIECVGCGS